MERWQTARLISVDEQGRATVQVDPDGEGEWPKQGSSFLVRVRKPRNPKHHRLYWGMLGRVVDATDHWPTKDAAHDWIKYQMGLYTIRAWESGRVIIEWKSTDFMGMDQVDFRDFFNRAVGYIAIETGIDPLDLKKEAEETTPWHKRAHPRIEDAPAVIHPDEVKGLGEDEWRK